MVTGITGEERTAVVSAVPITTPRGSRGRGRIALCLLAPLLLPLATGCGDPGGLAGAGATPTASGPVHLWPGRKGAVVPPADPAGAPPEYVPGIAPLQDQNVHTIDPVTLVQAEVRAHPDTVSGPDGMPQETADAIGACGKPGSDPAKCPVLTPYYQDLTGNGKDDLIVGIQLPDQMMSVRVYTADEAGRLNRIMATTDTVISVELANEDVILHVPSANAGYEVNTTWSWDSKQRSMLPTHEQIVRVNPPNPANPVNPLNPMNPMNPTAETPAGTPAGTSP